ncbi:unnamed protein product [Bemisia tabaci]|uniref:protein-glutamine gamma-glutamyltransferase n=1 Tax=Bemisia tabaci TaxID=7038 RepID=A0A9P0AHA7_BEMTA|nr:unnamed protein product [Bemisia tabaci]
MCWEIMENWYRNARRWFTPRTRGGRRMYLDDVDEFDGAVNTFFDLPKPPTLPASSGARDSNLLIVTGVDFCHPENGAEHFTDQYDLMKRETKYRQLVVRRGFPFLIKVITNRPFSPNNDAITLHFFHVDAIRPSQGQGTLEDSVLVLKGENPVGKWATVLEVQQENELSILVTPVADCIIGRWILEIDAKVVGPIPSQPTSFSVKTPFYILYNAWCPDDQVYLQDEEKRREYVLNDSGIIFRGNAREPRPSPWRYSQFETDILECAFYLLNTVAKRLNVIAASDPIEISRCLAALVNDVDDNGVVQGNWSENFVGGTPPSAWISSGPILTKYYSTKRPVRYGQCWVFAGVLTTVCRTLGLPTRTITCYNAAHDTDGSLTVDTVVTEDGLVDKNYSRDSIWNFHCWNEVWMKRPDLNGGQGYDGWQVIDSTPQERSQGVYRVGPTSVLAIRDGEVLKAYDGKFVFAEVNADKLTWKLSDNFLKLLNKNVTDVGVLICTKAVDSWALKEITHHYKHPERTKNERSTFEKALKQCESQFSRYYLNNFSFTDVKFELLMDESVIIGSPFTSLVRMTNQSDNRYEIKVVIRVDTSSYDGRAAYPVKKREAMILLKPAEVEEFAIQASYDEYADKLVGQADFKVNCLCQVINGDYEFWDTTNFRVKKPDIELEVSHFMYIFFERNMTNSEV